MSEYIFQNTSTRLDRFLRRLYPGLTQGALEKLLRSKKILVDGKPAKSNTRVDTEEQVRILVDLSLYTTHASAPPKREIDVTAKDLKWIESIIIWEDDQIIALNKPQGLAVQGGTGTKRHIDAIMKAYNPEARLVHRIDKDTSGVLVMAKTIPMAQYLTHLFSNHGVQKTYRAIVEGSVRPAQGTITLAIGKEMVGNKEKMVVEGPHAKPAETQYMLRKKLGNNFAVVDCWPRSGRTHQIRVHLSASGWPIVGDYKYGASEKGLTLHLHAHQLSFPLPDGGKMVITAPLSEHMRATCHEFGVDSDKLEHS
jgi:23S rRNA pseudouridine955/2504/2580 synthase